VASFELLSKYLLIMLLRLDKILYYDLGNESLDRAISNVHAGRRFPTPALHVSFTTSFSNRYCKAGAVYSSGTAMVVPVFLLNNRFQFQETWSQNC